MRRVNSAKPIWQKTTATSSMPLQRVKNNDIEATLPNIDEPTILRNAEERKLIAEAKSITRARSARRVQSATQRTDFTSGHKSQQSLPTLTKNKRPESGRSSAADKKESQGTMNEFISMKKQMFRVELANTQIKKEISQIVSKTASRKEALEQSTRELEADKLDLHKHIERNKKEKKEKEEELKLKEKEKNAKIEELSKLDQQINETQKRITKNFEFLELSRKYRRFIEVVAGKDAQENRNHQKRELYRQQRDEWVLSKRYKDPEMLKVIFEYPDIFPQESIDEINKIMKILKETGSLETDQDIEGKENLADNS
jgi:hypothetical protein